MRSTRWMGRLLVLVVAVVFLAACQTADSGRGGGPGPAPAPGGEGPTTAPTATDAAPAPTLTATEPAPTPVEVASPTVASSPAVAPSPEPTETAPAPTATAAPTTAPTAAPAADVEPQVEVVATGLEVPWAMAWAPDGRLFVTERPGRVRLVVDGQLQDEPVAEIPVAAVGEGGLMGLALDPDFADNGYVYTMYTYSEGAGLANRISRWELRDGRLQDEFTLLEGIPGARNHNGGRIAFGPDNKLYATTGDAGRGALAQDLESLAGKILRLNPDGSVPDDNPFEGSFVYSYGHRNPQGLAWRETGQLLAPEHGPSGEGGLCCRDEVNVIRPGANYGWPVVTGRGDERFADPLAFSGTNNTWAPSGAAVYDGSDLPAWRGDLLFGALRGQHLHRLVLEGEDEVALAEEEELFAGEFGRLRAVAMGPDGRLYVATSNRDGRGRPAADDDRILRVVAAPSP